MVFAVSVEYTRSTDIGRISSVVVDKHDVWCVGLWLSRDMRLTNTTSATNMDLYLSGDARYKSGWFA